MSGLVLCTCAYQISVVRILFRWNENVDEFGNFWQKIIFFFFFGGQLNPSEEPSKLILCVSYSCAMFTQIFIQSYFGSVVSSKSDRLTHDLFSSNWMETNKNERVCLIIAIGGTIKTIVIWAVGLFALNFSTLLKVISIQLFSAFFSYLWSSIRFYLFKLLQITDFKNSLFHVCTVAKYPILEV